MKRYILTFIAALSVLCVMAQEETNTSASGAYVRPAYSPVMEQDKYLSISIGGGINTLIYDYSLGDAQLGKGGRFNIDYNIFFNELCGITFGIGGSKFNSATNFDINSTYTTDIKLEVTNSNNITKDYDAACTTTFDGWSEKQTVYTLDIPLGAIFRYPLNKKMTILGNAGFKFSLPIKSSYEVTEGTTTTSVYLMGLNARYDSVPSHGVKTSDLHNSSSSKTKLLSANAYIDINLAHRIGMVNLFYGIYADYGLTSLAKQEKCLNSIYEYNGILASDAVNRVVPVSLGIRVGAKIPCPRLKDQDKDGVLDIDDHCPDTPAGLPVDSRGCPLDTDKDGVYDYLDRCGDTPRGVVVDTCGCPIDTDGDGVPDHLDKCPYTPKNTPVDNFGCPFDADGDGVPDHADKCPNTPEGVNVDQNGCPLDTDADGIPDYLDKCPTIPGIEANQGCPEISEYARKAFKAAEHGIQFEPGTANLVRSSYGYIDKIIQIMREFPNYRLVVNGHTDAAGSMGVNLKLSKHRAMAIVDYMVERGIYPTRLKSFGHGGTQPIADNTSAAGRKLNNRIEFKIEFEK